MAGDVENSEASTFFREGLEVRLDENLDGLFARINLDTNGRVAKVDKVRIQMFDSVWEETAVHHSWFERAGSDRHSFSQAWKSPSLHGSESSRRCSFMQALNRP